MTDNVVSNIPGIYEEIKEATFNLKFEMASDLQTGCLLKTLVASKAKSKFLELGTGTGLATSWIVAGMDNESSLVSVDNNSKLIDVARKYLSDKRVEFVLADGYEWILQNQALRFDFIFADAMPGKYDLFDETMNLLKPAGFYIIDDMLPQPNWPSGHSEKVDEYLNRLENRTDLTMTKLNWSTGLVIVVKN